jgi:hypothetical protein
MLSLAIHHNVWLTRDQRYAIHNGIELVVIGVSIPVWVSEKRMTSEPAKEIFCKYFIKNPKFDAPIQIVNDGYEITLPNREGTLPNLTDEDWRYLNMNDPSKLTAMYDKCQKASNSKNLLDLCDGGSKNLSFREHNKGKIGNEPVNFIHFVNIEDIDLLKSTMI